MTVLLSNAEAQMQSAMKRLNSELNTIRAGRANPSVLDRVQVDYYGAMTPIEQMAAVSVAENRILVITPWDKSTLESIEKAILKSDIGISPTNDGTVIRVVFPQPTEERRKELCKDVRALGEEAKVQVRNARRDANNKLKDKKDVGEISEDDLARAEKDVQNLTDKFVTEIDHTVASKEKEVLEI